MSITGIVFALVLTTLVLVLVVLPLFQRGAASPGDALADKQRERLLVYYERVLRNIRDLDEDHALGKIAEGEYRQERELWAARGVQVLKALDSLAEQSMIAPSPVEDAAVDLAIDEAIEAAVRDLRRTSQPSTDRVAE